MDKIDWLHVLLAVLVPLGPVLVHFAVARGWITPGAAAKAAKAFGILQEAADAENHGVPWTRAAVETAKAHSGEIVDLVTSAIPDRLLEDAGHKVPDAGHVPENGA